MKKCKILIVDDIPTNVTLIYHNKEETRCLLRYRSERRGGPEKD